MSPGEVWEEVWWGRRRVLGASFPAPTAYELSLGPRRAAALNERARRVLCGALAGLTLRQMAEGLGWSLPVIALDLRRSVTRLALPDHRALARLLPAALRPAPALALRGALPLLAPAALVPHAGGVTLRAEVPPARLPPHLPARDRELLRLVLAGLTNARIGAEFGVKACAVEWRLATLFVRLGARRRTDLDPALLPLLELAPAPLALLSQRHPLHVRRHARPGGPRGPRECRLWPPGRVPGVDAGAHWA